ATTLLAGTQSMRARSAKLVSLAPPPAKAKLRNVKLTPLQLVQRFFLLCGQNFHRLASPLVAELGSRGLIEATARKQIALLLGEFRVQGVQLLLLIVGQLELRRHIGCQQCTGTLVSQTSLQRNLLQPFVLISRDNCLELGIELLVQLVGNLDHLLALFDGQILEILRIDSRRLVFLL